MVLSPSALPSTVSAIDLGSNSFHMIVSRPQEGQLTIIDRLRESVRFAAGLDADNNLSEEIQSRALACLERFGQRLREMPEGSVRVVGTNTLRIAGNAAPFLVQAQQALGRPIEIISGLEEARLVYLGVAHDLAEDGARRLVVDIGGSSTELIIGANYVPLDLQSLQMGCVTLTSRFFADGAISRKSFKAAELTARVELEPLEEHLRRLDWSFAIGASGTIRAVSSVVRAAGWAEHDITRPALQRLVEALMTAGHADNLKLKGLNPERAPVFAAGVAILSAVFEGLGIERMQVSDKALREGVLYDLVGRIRHEDIRDQSVTALAARYYADMEQATRVEQTARHCLAQVAEPWKLNEDDNRQWLGWAAKLHEIGLNIAHNQYHKHSEYIIQHADLMGFSAYEQKLLATLVRAHRRKFPVAAFREIPDTWQQPLQRLAVLLRLAVTIHRSRISKPFTDFAVVADKKSLTLQFPEDWLDRHPLTRADLEDEARYLSAIGCALSFA